MPDWKITVTRTFGKGKTIARDIVVPEIDNINLARIKGIDEVLKWAEEEDSPIPLDALNYWNEAKGTALNPWEVLSELELRWNLTFIVENLEQAGSPAPVTEAPPVERPRPPQKRNGASPQAFDFKAMLAMVRERYAYLIDERKRIDAELADIGKFVVAIPQEKKRGRPRKRVVSEVHQGN